eukprot:5585451-Amphidinium_carterae.1
MATNTLGTAMQFEHTWAGVPAWVLLDLKALCESGEHQVECVLPPEEPPIEIRVCRPLKEYSHTDAML